MGPAKKHQHFFSRSTAQVLSTINFTWNYTREQDRRCELVRWRRWWRPLCAWTVRDNRCGSSCRRMMMIQPRWRGAESDQVPAAAAAAVSSISDPSSSTSQDMFNDITGLYRASVLTERIRSVHSLTAHLSSQNVSSCDICTLKDQSTA